MNDEIDQNTNFSKLPSANFLRITFSQVGKYCCILVYCQNFKFCPLKKPLSSITSLIKVHFYVFRFLIKTYFFHCWSNWSDYFWVNVKGIVCIVIFIVGVVIFVVGCDFEIYMDWFATISFWWAPIRRTIVLPTDKVTLAISIRIAVSFIYSTRWSSWAAFTISIFSIVSTITTS